MNNLRLRFIKTGRSVYISHLDLLHTIQRSFSRAGIPLAHSEGFNPHPATSIALPLSLGQESICEILDFKLITGFKTDLSSITESLNKVLPEGIEIIETYEPDRKIIDLKFLEISGVLEYDNRRVESKSLNEFFKNKEIIINKKSKSGIKEFDVKNAISELSFYDNNLAVFSSEIKFNAIISAQNPTLNPEMLIESFRQLNPILLPDYYSFKRIETYDSDMKVFR